MTTLNGLDPFEFKREVLDINGVGEQVEIVKPGNEVDVVVFGPYGSNIPPPGPYVRVAYICENIRYDGPPCDFLFRVPLANVTGVPSARIQWHGLDPRRLIKTSTRDVESICKEKESFCVFLYSNRVPYREKLFRALSKYKRIDAPGLSMNNHTNIDLDVAPGESRWETKRRFLRKFKFTLAFENDIHPGYQTEKLFDSMLADSIPVYIGDRNVTSIFDERSFINFAGGETGYWVQRLENFAQLRFFEIFGAHSNRMDVRITRKLRRLSRDAYSLHLANKITGALVDRVVAIDRDPDAYRDMQCYPWLKDNCVPEASYTRDAWQAVFGMVRDTATRAKRRASGPQLEG